MTTKEFEDGTITFKDDQETKDKVFNALLDLYYMKYELFSGEAICQTDDGVIKAHEVLSDIADDIIQFDSEYMN